MAGRNNQPQGERRALTPRDKKAPRPQYGQHGSRDGSPHKYGSGRRRADKGVREKDWARFNDAQLDDTQSYQRHGEGLERLKDRQSADSFGAKLDGALVKARVIEVRKGNFLAELLEAPELPAGNAPIPPVIRVVPRGMLQHFDLGLSSLVAAGDLVQIVVPPVQGNHEYEGMLAKVEPRKTEFRRRHPSGRALQTIAANVDQVLIAASCAEPDFRPGFVDRVLACASASALPAVLVVNKIDLGVSSEVQELLEVYRTLGVLVFKTCALTGASGAGGIGLEPLREHLQGKRSAFCGHSGVGKSSLLTALMPETANAVRVGEISNYTGKGQHTTTHARLYRSISQSYELIDTPGVREFMPADTTRGNLWAHFPEIARLQGHCQFRDCAHKAERGCAVLEAVSAGKIHPRRHESFVRILETLPE